ncbi:hypothetical protein [Paraburkholderia domus]|uniref:hypothetical protein n=1 Tax=Paraburkholderia domus TaxID=2793075 RepID=UPI001913774B|nr:hypothetical protein [Paraburkholderia domus]MBK5065805.1 hypothetical protein [Burkholderia sp. R-70199]CAE6963324.1 hypothetical protein R70199_07496 [Paraburkholderia domus]
MEIIDIFVECPSGLNLSFRGAFNPDTQAVSVSDHLASIVRASCTPGEDAVISAVIDGQWRSLALTGHSKLSVAPGESGPEPVRGDFWRRVVEWVIAPTIDQRQQFGRFCHTIAAAALIGGVASWYGTTGWTVSTVLKLGQFALAFVLTFTAGMVAIKGEG